jgi:tetratricopeptide (TPR) repeat protein
VEEPQKQEENPRPNLTPPARPASFESEAQSSPLRVIGAAGFVVLVLAAIAVVFLLPQHVARRSGEHTPSELPMALDAGRLGDESALAPPAAPDVETLALRKEAISKHARLEAESAEIWGEERVVTSYSEATQALTRSELLFANEDVEEAAAAFRDAIELLDRLEASRQDRALMALEIAGEALAHNDAATARSQYALALAADPANQAASEGLGRAEHRDEVLERLDRARVHESNRELDMALAEYQQAVALDEAHEPARQGLQRVESQLEEHAFQRAMSDALGALQRSEFAAARSALEEAKHLRPDSPAIRDAERQLGELSRSSKMNRLAKQADGFAEKEDWQAALTAYEAALKVDPKASFAIRGKARAERNLEIHSHMDALLAKPTDLQDPDRATFAEKIIKLARTSPDAGPTFRAKAERLEAALVGYNTLTKLTIRSDGKTGITIHRIGRLAPTLERTLELRPGHYIATGTRSGYRDVRVDFTVPVGKATTVTIACEDKI